MAEAPTHADRPIRRISTWKAFGLFCLAAFLILLGVVFIPWDVKAPDDADLELPTPSLALADNGFVWLEKAGLGLVDNFPSRPSGDGLDRWDGDLISEIESPHGKWDPIFAAEVLAANAAVFLDIEKGLACRQFTIPRSISAKDRLVYLQKHKKLGSLLRLKSKRAQLAGDPAGAAQAALQAFRLGQVITDNSHNLIEWLVGTLAERLALSPLQDLATDAKTPETVLVKILAPLDERRLEAIDAGYQNAVRGEYALRRQLIQDFQAGKYRNWYAGWMQAGRFVPYMLKPNMTARDLAACCRHYMKNASLPRSRMMPGYPGQSSTPASVVGKMWKYAWVNSVGMAIFREEAEVLGPALEKKFPLLTTLAALRLQIALRLYEQKHGRLPETLGELVPEFLPAVPNDPYDDQPFRYSKARKLVWSVGQDGIDDGGKAYHGAVMYYNSEKGYDAVMPFGTRELKPNLVQPAGK
jgi:hypothetical protein